MADLTLTIAIIAILAAILFPVFARAREKARSASCVGNLVNIALALRTYAADNDMAYPPRDNDLEPLWPVYLNNKQSFLCPSVSVGVPMGSMPKEEEPEVAPQPGPVPGPPPPPVGMPPPEPTEGPPRPPEPPPPPGWMPPPPAPSQEDEDKADTCYFYVSGYRYDQFTRRMPISGDLRAWHNERRNVLFTDGSVRSWTRADYRRAGLDRYVWMDGNR